MGSAQLTLTAGAVSLINIPNPCGRVVATMISAAAETYITADGNVPVTPTSTPNTSNQTVLAPVAGAQAVLQPILPGSGIAGPQMAGPAGTTLPQIQLLSAGTPVIELEW